MVILDYYAETGHRDAVEQIDWTNFAILTFAFAYLTRNVHTHKSYTHACMHVHDILGPELFGCEQLAYKV